MMLVVLIFVVVITAVVVDVVVAVAVWRVQGCCMVSLHNDAGGYDLATREEKIYLLTSCHIYPQKYYFLIFLIIKELFSSSRGVKHS